MWCLYIKILDYLCVIWWLPSDQRFDGHASWPHIIKINLGIQDGFKTYVISDFVWCWISLGLSSLHSAIFNCKIQHLIAQARFDRGRILKSRSVVCCHDLVSPPQLLERPMFISVFTHGVVAKFGKIRDNTRVLSVKIMSLTCTTFTSMCVMRCQYLSERHLSLRTSGGRSYRRSGAVRKTSYLTVEWPWTNRIPRDGVSWDENWDENSRYDSFNVSLHRAPWVSNLSEHPCD